MSGSCGKDLILYKHYKLKGYTCTVDKINVFQIMTSVFNSVGNIV